MNSEYESASSMGAVIQTLTPPNSPVQEHHIDFLLEEEFACNSVFLDFFVEAAKEHFKPLPIKADDAKVIQPCSEWNCKVIRSVTTGKGETDVLAIYHSADTASRVAILIENKIRAGFQKDQAERYWERGEAGKKNKEWELYWTCLISPEKYAKDNPGFHTRLCLEKLATFFSGEDERTRFKLGVIQRALRRFAETGLQIKDETMTRFRAFYAKEAACFFAEGEVNWPKARDAWWDDTWFNFKGGGIPLGAEIVHKPRAGFIDLAANGGIDFAHGNPLWRYYELRPDEIKKHGLQELSEYLPSDEAGANVISGAMIPAPASIASERSTTTSTRS